MLDCDCDGVEETDGEPVSDGLCETLALWEVDGVAEADPVDVVEAVSVWLLLCVCDAEPVGLALSDGDCVDV